MPKANHAQPQDSPPGYVYVLQAGEFFKIGYSGNHPRHRAGDISTSCPMPVTLIGYLEMDAAEQHEKTLHKQYAAARVRGEWFRLESWEVEKILAKRPGTLAHLAQDTSEPVMITYRREELPRVPEAESRIVADCLAVWPAGAQEASAADLIRGLTAIPDAPWKARWTSKVSVAARELPWFLLTQGIEAVRVASADGTGRIGYRRAQLG